MKSTRTFISSLFFLLLFAIAAFGQTATIAAWNLGGFEPIPPLRVGNQVRAIRNMNPDVMILSEVNPNTVATDIARQLGNYQTILIPQGAMQNLAILYKTDSSCVVNAQLIRGSDNNNNRLRKAIAAYVQVGKFDFIVVGVHMKASRGNGAPDFPQSTRTRQAQAIARFIDSSSLWAEKDFLVVGDYNMIPGDDNINFTELSPGTGQNELLRYVSSESLAGQVSHIGSCPNGQARGNLLDGFAISGRFTREYIPNSLRIIPFTDTSIFTGANGAAFTCANYRGLVSDHFPLVAKFRADTDDD